MKRIFAFPTFYIFTLLFLNLTVFAEPFSTKDNKQTKEILQMSVNIFLEGPYNESNGLMTSMLYNNNLLDTFKFNLLHPFVLINGERILKMLPGSTVPNGAVDLVRFHLRQPFFPYLVVDTANAWLMPNGSIRDYETGKNNFVSFNQVSAGEYYVEVRHRNHLPIVTSIPIPFKALTTSNVNFSNSKLIRGSIGNFKVSKSGKVAMMAAGDIAKVFQQREINALDLYEEFEYRKRIPANALVFHVADLDMDGYVNDTDVKILRQNNSFLYHFPEIEAKEWLELDK